MRLKTPGHTPESVALTVRLRSLGPAAALPLRSLLFLEISFVFANLMPWVGRLLQRSCYLSHPIGPRPYRAHDVKRPAEQSLCAKAHTFCSWMHAGVVCTMACHISHALGGFRPCPRWLSKIELCLSVCLSLSCWFHFVFSSHFRVYQIITSTDH